MQCRSSLVNTACLGLTILSLAGRLIQSWKPCSILSSVGAGISLCTMPLPAVIHWTPPGPMMPCSTVTAMCISGAYKRKVMGLGQKAQREPAPRPNLSFA